MSQIARLKHYLKESSFGSIRLSREHVAELLDEIAINGRSRYVSPSTAAFFEGAQARENDATEGACPYEGELRNHWRQGWQWKDLALRMGLESKPDRAHAVNPEPGETAEKSFVPKESSGV